MGKLLKTKTWIIFLLAILVIIGIAVTNHFTPSKAAELDAKIILNEMDSLMEYQLPEGWEFKETSAFVKIAKEKKFIGNIYIGKENMGSVPLNNPIYECINVNIYNTNHLSVEENKEEAAINFGYSHDNYTFEKAMTIDGETAYCGTINHSDTTEKVIVVTHDTWSVDLYLTSEGTVSEEQVAALYYFAESIKFKN